MKKCVESVGDGRLKISLNWIQWPENQNQRQNPGAQQHRPVAALLLCETDISKLSSGPRTTVTVDPSDLHPVVLMKAQRRDEPFLSLNQTGPPLEVAELSSGAMFNLAELLSQTVPLPHIPSSRQTAPKVDK